MEKILIDALGAFLGVSAAMVLFSTFYSKKDLNAIIYSFGLLFAVLINVCFTAWLQNTALLIMITISIVFAMSFYFDSPMTAKILLSFIVIAILYGTELIAGFIFVNVLEIPIVLVQSNATLYMVGVITSKLLALLIAFIIRAIMKRYKGETDNQFNLIMAFMPMQSIVICFVVSSYSINAGVAYSSPTGIVAILISILLVYLTMILIRNQRKAFQYKSEYNLSQQRLVMQAEHYQKLYFAQREVRAIRHDISDKLVAIYGFLSNNQVDNAMEHIRGITNDVENVSEVIDTGHPPIDAVINAKFAKAEAEEIKINVEQKIRLNEILNVNQFDVAIIIANALDNAIEGIQRSDDVDRSIKFDIIDASGYISILVENQSAGPVYDGFKTSKPEKMNHGFGIEHMKMIAKKYQGDVNPKYDPSTQTFTLEILLKNIKI